jgi:hypothetical protein
MTMLMEEPVPNDKIQMCSEAAYAMAQVVAKFARDEAELRETTKLLTGLFEDAVGMAWARRVKDGT